MLKNKANRLLSGPLLFKLNIKVNRKEGDIMPQYAPNPEFLRDRESNQNICFRMFVKKLTDNFIALSPDAYDDIVNHVRRVCEVFYDYERGTEGLELLGPSHKRLVPTSHS